MNDFLKIFFVLCAVVSAFFFGRNYGEETRNESTEIKTLKSENFQNSQAQSELINLKEKIQKILDSADANSPNETLGSLNTVFVADLNLVVPEKKQRDISESKKENVTIMPTPSPQPKLEIFDSEKFRTSEEKLIQSENANLAKVLLKQVEVKRVDSLLLNAAMMTYDQSKKFSGTYRGSVIDVTDKIYGTLSIDLTEFSEENLIKGSIVFYKNGQEQGRKDFETNSIGYVGQNSQSTVIEFDQDYLQIYKIGSSKKIAGIYYDRLPNGTSKTIGTFVLSRTDFVE